MIGCRADELSFTTSGTQAVHLGLLGAVAARQSAARGPGHLVSSAVEHSSVLNTADWLASRSGMDVSTTGVDRLGRADLDEFVAALQPGRTVLACLQTANNEVATLQPVAEAAAACAERKVPLFVDAAATAGRLPAAPGWSVLAASAHKWGGPAGVGVLAVRKGVRWREPGPGDDREGRRVPGSRTCPRYWRPRPR